MFCSYQLNFTQVSTNYGSQLNFGNFLSGCHYYSGCLDKRIALCLELHVAVRLALSLKFFGTVTYYDHGPQEVPFSFYAFLFRYLSHLFFVFLESWLGLRLYASYVPSLGQVTQVVYSLRLSFVKQTSPQNSRFAVTE